VLAREIPEDGQLIVRFPSQYTFESNNNIDCEGNSGFTDNNFKTTVNSDGTLIIIRDAFPTTLNSISFTISGITNPTYAVETDIF
jgi:hypothetical protein